MATQIKFGTSGWRAIMADEFTFANVRRAVTGIARYVVSQEPAGARVLVGRDPRFLGETFCAMASRNPVAHGITPIVIPDAAPTPAISYAVSHEKASGAINFTASHNPPEYNGIKFSTPDGAPALPEVTKQIEAAIAAIRRRRASIPKLRATCDRLQAARAAGPVPSPPARTRRPQGHQPSQPARSSSIPSGARPRLFRRAAARSRRRR